MMLRWGKEHDHESEEMDVIGFNVLGSGDDGVIKSNNNKRLVIRSSRIKIMSICELWGPRFLKGMPYYCFNHHPSDSSSQAIVEKPFVLPHNRAIVLPPKKQWLSSGFLQWRAQSNESSSE
ncbi:hypothetical protein AHAS_Ahas11G0320900 [Arachis hypogaea]